MMLSSARQFLGAEAPPRRQEAQLGEAIAMNSFKCVQGGLRVSLHSMSVVGSLALAKSKKRY